MSLYSLLDNSFLSHMIEVVRFFLQFYMIKTVMGVGIFIVLTSFYKIIQLSRSAFISMTINLNKIIFLFLTTLTSLLEAYGTS